MADVDRTLAMRWRLSDDRNAVWSLSNDGRDLEVAVTYVTDSFAGLLLAAADVRLGATNTNAIFGGEPMGSILFISGSDEQCLLRLVSFSAMSVALTRFTDGSLRWHGTVTRLDFVDAVAAMADEVLRGYGASEFERRWGHPFPFRLLEALR